MGSGGYRLSHKLPTKGGTRLHPWSSEFSWTLQEILLGLTQPLVMGRRGLYLASVSKKPGRASREGKWWGQEQ